MTVSEEGWRHHPRCTSESSLEVFKPLFVKPAYGSCLLYEKPQQLRSQDFCLFFSLYKPCSGLFSISRCWRDDPRLVVAIADPLRHCVGETIARYRLRRFSVFEEKEKDKRISTWANPLIAQACSIHFLSSPSTWRPHLLMGRLRGLRVVSLSSVISTWGEKPVSLLWRTHVDLAVKS